MIEHVGEFHREPANDNRVYIVEVEMATDVELELKGPDI